MNDQPAIENRALRVSDLAVSNRTSAYADEEIVHAGGRPAVGFLDATYSRSYNANATDPSRNQNQSRCTS
jgi:hypothetical protein